MQKLNKKLYESYTQYPEKILQFGEGNFLRAFVDWQIEQLNRHTDFNGSVAVVQPRGSEKIKRLNDQDGLFTLFLQGMKGGEAVNEKMIINSISRGIDLFSDYDEFKKLASSEELRFIISNTTEAGIVCEKEDRLEDRPQKTFPGKLTAFLYFRYQAFAGDETKGCVLIPCELIENNGQKLKESILHYADLWELEEGFTQWIQNANSFCNSLVDRIVPGFPVDSMNEINAELGYQDELIVVGEQYYLWVIEGPNWIGEELPFAAAGLHTKIVSDLTPYRLKKVRILNGAHTAMTPVASLYGLKTVRDSVEHPAVGRFVEELIHDEILPVLKMEGLTQYAEDVLNRFKNPYIKHYVESIALNSVSKFKTRNLPTLQEYVEQKGQLPARLVFSLSALLYVYRKKEMQDDPAVLQFFQEVWNQETGDMLRIASALLGEQWLWGANLNEIPKLTERVADYLNHIQELGMERALEQCCLQRGKVL
ncbi:tagaturonate reductase [Bacillus halotolerans]|uniref:tagaturonate reductase n=1 Tax=Bacillus halotolerans TaxID=260554 RepID=UPI002DBDB17F|nr:tagaturonate reductase [Bacillus halotolerans]MEC0251216.1 tagaturonate reductase [Bacillus halotolerans]MEC0358452.1 tagaturonate reductase [Bacillus halotolerans]